jgi:ComF family protein
MLRSWAAFGGPVRNAIHRLKYRHDVSLGEAIAAQLPVFVRDLHWVFDLIIPVPLSQNRLRERGYNQVGLIARPLSMAVGIAYAPDALVRERETLSQVGLGQLERRENVCGAFHANRSFVNNRVVMLVDDVATTGSTLSSCAEALYAAGSQDVFAITVARAVWQRDLVMA